MADLGATNWSPIDASNDAAPPNGWPEGMFPGDVNNSARAQMGGEKRWWQRSNAVLTSSGATTAFTLTYPVAEAAYYDGEVYVFVADRDCVAAATLNSDGLGAKAIHKFTAGAWAAVANGDWKTGQIVSVRYNISDTTFQIVNVSVSWTDFVLSSLPNTFSALLTMSGAAINEAKGADIASATTTDIGAATGNFVHVTGTTTITGLGTIQAGARRIVEFAGILTLTHNGTSLILPTGANITTAAGDVATFVSEGSGNWRCATYTRADGTPLAALPQPAPVFLAADVAMNNIANYFDGPSLVLTAGTYDVTSRLTVSAFNAASNLLFKLWDGSTVYDSGWIGAPNNNSVTAPAATQIVGFGRITVTSTATLKLSVRNPDVTTGSILFNATGNSKDSVIKAIRIA